VCFDPEPAPPCPVAPEDGTGVAPVDGTGVFLPGSQQTNPAWRDVLSALRFTQLNPLLPLFNLGSIPFFVYFRVSWTLFPHLAKNPLSVVLAFLSFYFFIPEANYLTIHVLTTYDKI